MSDSLTYYRKKLLNTADESDIVDAEGDSLSNDLVLSDETNYLLLAVTEEEYLQLLSAAFNGVYTTYPQNPLGVVYPLIKAGKVSICDAIISCINDSESGVSDAILGLVGGNTYESARAYGQSQNDVDMSSATNPTCDKDILYGQARQLVDYLDQLNTDFFEIYEVAGNTYEFIAEVVGDITFIDESSLDAALSWVEFIHNSIAENYAAQVTTAYLESVACEIFCAAKDTCEITPTILYNIFKDRLSSSISIDGVIWDTLDFLAGGSWSGTQIADFMFFSQLALRSQLGKYFEKFAYQDINTRLTIYANDPDPDWSTLCTDCGWEYTFDFVNVDYTSYIDTWDSAYAPTWLDGTGLEGGRDANGCGKGFYFDLGSDTEITFAEAFINWNMTDTNPRYSGLNIDENAPASTTYQPTEVPADQRNVNTPVGSGSNNYELTGDWSGINAIVIWLGSRQGIASYSRITALTVRGVGYNPFTSYP